MAISEYYLVPPLPKGLESLAEFALDLRWSWSHESDAIWDRIDPELWGLTRNPWLILQTVPAEQLAGLAKDVTFREQLADLTESQQQRSAQPCWFAEDHPDTAVSVAYFSLEFGLSEALPIYSGGLGILAGDYLKTASDLGVPVTGVGILYQQGYFRQVIDADGGQMEFHTYNDPSQLPILPVRDQAGEWLRVDLDLPGRCLRLRAWEARVGSVTLYLLDSNDPANSPADQCITAELYGGGPEMRLQQEMVLGIGGWRLLRDLGLEPDICHLNEGHAALAVLERARSFMATNGVAFDEALTATRAGNLFTTHTPVEAGFDRFPPALAQKYLGHFGWQVGIDLDDILALGRRDPTDRTEPLNMAYLAVRGSGMVNGVSRLHGDVSRRILQPLFPRWPEHEVPVTQVTNGVHMPSWDSAAADQLWHKACGKGLWRGSMAALQADFARVTDEDLWALRNEGCRDLIEYARERLVRQRAAAGADSQHIDQVAGLLDPNALTMGFARRFATYKRPDLLLTDPERLARLFLDTHRPIQLVIAGKAHPKDEAGKSLIQAWSDFIRRPGIESQVVFVEDYDMSVAEHLVQGVDLWLNTPRRPWEASGTSGMKVLVNGGLNLSELDGWWAEAYRPEVGWAIGDGREHGNEPGWDAQEADQLYRLLEEDILLTFYERDGQGLPNAWIARMRLSMSGLAPCYSSNRMLREYVEKLYLPAAQVYRARVADGGRGSTRLCNWHKALSAQWHYVRFGVIETEEQAGHHLFSVPVHLEDIDPEAVRVELYAQPLNGTPAEIHPMARKEDVPATAEGYVYTVRIPADRPARDYTPRIVPACEGALVPIEANEILWYQ